MKTARKALMLIICAALLVSATVMGTLAYLTSDDTVTNTFSIGKVEITLTEAPVGENGKKIDGDRVKANKYKLYPGKEYDKDPTVFVDANSEDCYIYVTVANGISAIEGDTTIAAQMATKGWTEIGNTGVYTDNKVHKPKDEVVVFEHFTIDSAVKSVSDYENAQIVVKAYAIQKEGFANATAAWEAAKGDLGFNA